MLSKLTFRFFKNLYQEFDEVYRGIRSKKLYPDSKVLSLAIETPLFEDEIRIANLSYILSATYKPIHDYNVAFYNLEEKISDKLKLFTDKTYFRIVLNYQYAYRQSYKNVSKMMLENLLKRSKYFVDNEKRLRLFNLLSVLCGQYEKQSVDYLSYFSNFFESINLKDLNISEVCSCLEIFPKIKFANPRKNSEILKKYWEILIEKLEKLNLDDLTLTQKFSVLKNLVLIEEGSEDFLRTLEKLVFTNLIKLEVKEVNQLLLAYDKRRTHDYFYMINEIYSKFYENYLGRFEKISINLLSQFFHHFWSTSKYYGMFCDKKIEPKILYLLNDSQKIDSINFKTKIQLILNILNFANHANLNDLSDKIFSIIYNDIESIDLNLLLIYACSFSRNQSIPIEFWEFFSTKIEEILENSDKLTYLYAIYLNLSLQNPEAYEIIAPKLKDHLKNLKNLSEKEKKAEVNLRESSQLQKNVVNVLNKLKIDNFVEYFDEYFIDVAVPSLKIAFEIQGPGHFIFPARSLNGQTLNKMKNLEKMGWNYVALPFFKLRPTDKQLESLIRSSIPLKF